MTFEAIEKFMENQNSANSVVQISFKTRRSVKGLFIRTNDYDDLRRKNLWRIVSEQNINSYNQSHNADLARIFNGTEFTRLEVTSM
jgi:hypothetical protein